MFRYHPTFKFIQLHKNLSGNNILSMFLPTYTSCIFAFLLRIFLEAAEKGSDIYRLKTEDGIEVKRLFIKILDKSIECEEIKLLLSTYGSIEEIVIFGKHAKSGWKMRNRGFVTFTKASNATSALINRKKFEDFFILSPADTWNQPDYCPSRSTDGECYSEEQSSKLLELLNEDCLLHIMTFLDILDVLSLRKVCKKLSDVGGIHFKSITKLNFSSIKSKKKLTVHEAKLVMEAVGSNIVNISVNSEKFYNQRVLNFIPKYLKSLKHLHLTGFKLESLLFWDQMANVLIRLETLDLNDNSEINENFLRSFDKSTPTLKTLNISNCNINGEFLKMLPNLQSLNISGCRYINGKQMIMFLNTNNKLKSLNISKCPNISGKDVNDMLKIACQIERLSLNNYYIDDETSRFVIPSINTLLALIELTIQNINYPPCDQLLRTINFENFIETLDISYGNLTLTSVYAISTMKHLKKLIMNFKNSVPEDFVDYLSELERLEEFHVSACSISPTNVLRLIHLTKLRFLDISRCYGFTNEFIIESVKILKETQPRKVFLMHVGQTEIDSKVLKESEMKAYDKYLQLCWKTAKDVEHDYDIDEENNGSEKLNQQEFFTIDGRNRKFMIFKCKNMYLNLFPIYFRYH